MVELPAHLRGASTGAGRISRAELAAHQRERVIASTIPVFAKRGYQATTVDDLLAAAKMGFGNFYSLFEGKEECFGVCLDHIVSTWKERLIEGASTGEDWAAQTYLGLDSLLGRLLEAPLEGRVVLLEAQSAGPAALSRYGVLIDEATAWLSRGRGSAVVELPRSFEQTTIFGLAYYLQQVALDPRSHDQETLLAETSSLLLEPLTGAGRLGALRRSALASVE